MEQNIKYIHLLYVPTMACNMGCKYCYLEDNTKDEKAIITKLKEAIKIAQKSGFAIAIGHPYEQTFKALKSFKSELESQVDIMLLRDLYEIYN